MNALDLWWKVCSQAVMSLRLGSGIREKGDEAMQVPVITGYVCSLPRGREITFSSIATRRDHHLLTRPAYPIRFGLTFVLRPPTWCRLCVAKLASHYAGAIARRSIDAGARRGGQNQSRRWLLMQATRTGCVRTPAAAVAYVALCCVVLSLS